MANKYAYNEEVDEAKTARAMAKSLKISPKHSVEICSAIRGMDVAKAKAYLADVIEMKKSVPFKRHNKNSKDTTKKLVTEKDKKDGLLVDTL